MSIFEEAAKEKEGKYKHYDILGEPFEIYGITYDEKRGKFLRMSADVAENVNKGVAGMYGYTAGGRIAFKSNTGFLQIAVNYGDIVYHHKKLSLFASNGFDVYVKNDKGEFEHIRSLLPEVSEDLTRGICECDLPAGINKEIIVNLPICSEIKGLKIGIDQDAAIEKWDGYSKDGRVVFYGSSITHGFCASRPGMIYPLIISRMLDCDILNLGFSGNAKGEDNMSEYIAGLDMKLFVCDYDHNAPDAEHLDETYGRIYKIFREKQPDTPILFVTRPDWQPYNMELPRKNREVIYKHYKNAVDSGDKNIYFLDGYSLFGEKDRDCCSIDAVHPNDIGFYKMAQGIGAEIKKILNW